MQGICFIEPLFLQTIQEIKNKTRRLVKLPSPQGDYPSRWILISQKNENGFAEFVDGVGHKIEVKPRYKVGETLYLKEPWQHAIMDDCGYGYYYGTGSIVDYSTDFSWFKSCIEENLNKWKILWEKYGEEKKNKLFMPASAGRYFIKITNVRIERLQDISDDDCLDEGIIEERPEFYDLPEGDPSFGVPDIIEGTSVYSGTWFNTPQDAYAALIDKINGKGTWNSNPYVYAYNYELIK